MAFSLPTFGTGSFQQLARIGTNQSPTSVTINAATISMAAIFMAAYTQNITGCIVLHRTNTGSPTGMACNLYAVDASGFPTGASLASATYTSTANAVNTITFGAPYAATAGTCYALVFTNGTATPASNNTQVMHSYDQANNIALQSSDSGSTWTAIPVGQSLYCGPVYSGAGSVAPFLYSTLNVAAASVALYNTSGSRVARSGVKVNFASDVILHRVGVRFTTKTGSPTHSLVGEVCSSSASLSTSTSSLSSATYTNLTGLFNWDGGYRLLRNTDYYICVTPSGATAGDASNYARLLCSTALLKPANINPLIDFYQSTATSPSFSVDTAGVPAMELWVEIPKPNQYFYAGMNGGFNG